MSSDSLRWGILSTARINDRILSALAMTERSRIVAVASRTPERATEYASSRRIPIAYGSYQELIQSSEVDAIYISLPNSHHAQWGIEAARAGKHALIEKPIALTPLDVRSIDREANDNGVVVQEASMMRFHPQTSLIRRLVADGAIGVPRFVQASFSFTLQRTDDIRLEMEGGGSVWDLGCYPVTLFQAALQLRPLEVTGFHRNGGTAVDMTFGAQIRYEGDVIGLFATSMEAVPSWSAEFVGSRGRIRVTYPWLSHVGVTSTVEVLSITDQPSTSTFGDGTDNQSIARYEFKDVNAYHDEITAFESMALDGTPRVFPLSESEVNVAVIRSLIESADRNRPVKVIVR